VLAKGTRPEFDPTIEEASKVPSELQAVLWDMDGTLVDSEPAWIQAQQRLVGQFGGTWTEADGLTLVGAGMDETITAMQRAGVTITPSLILDSLEDAVAKKFDRQIIWRPGVTQLVRSIGSAGIPQAIVTTSPRRLADLVANALAVHCTMSALVTGDDVARSKPDPEGYLLAARLLKVDITQSIAIEDSPTGLQAAERSGAVTVLIDPEMSEVSRSRATSWKTLEGRTVADLRRLIHAEDNGTR
jgi:HAD superfamily hydrolase (TIGR01509 family)